MTCMSYSKPYETICEEETKISVTILLKIFIFGISYDKCMFHKLNNATQNCKLYFRSAADGENFQLEIIWTIFILVLWNFLSVLRDW